jgi:hypothetical protein
MFWVMNKNKKTNHPHIAWQPELRPDIPTVYGPLDYRVFKAQLEEIDKLLLHGGIENDFVREALDTLPAGLSDKARAHHAKNASLALRSNIARKIPGLSCRDMAVRIAESELLRWFLCTNAPGMARAPSKSTLERNDKILPPERMEAFNRALIARCAAKDAPRKLGLHAPIDIDDARIDATCLKASIHFPIDWVLLRDAARTLMKAVACIRRHGLRQRMPCDPLRLLAEMNKLAMAMSACARKADAKKQRKKILRKNPAPDEKTRPQNLRPRASAPQTPARTTRTHHPGRSASRANHHAHGKHPRATARRDQAGARTRTNASSAHAWLTTPAQSTAPARTTSTCSCEAKPAPKSNSDANCSCAKHAKAW